MSDAKTRYCVLNTRDQFRTGSGSNWELTGEGAGVAISTRFRVKIEGMPLKAPVGTELLDIALAPRQQLLALVRDVGTGKRGVRIHSKNGWEEMVNEEFFGIEEATALAVSGDLIYLAGGEKIVCYSRRDGKRLWAFSVNFGPISAFAVGSLSQVYLVEKGLREVSVISSGGTLIDRFKLPETVGGVVDMRLGTDGTMYLLVHPIGEDTHSRMVLCRDVTGNFGCLDVVEYPVEAFAVLDDYLLMLAYEKAPKGSFNKGFFESMRRGEFALVGKCVFTLDASFEKLLATGLVSEGLVRAFEDNGEHLSTRAKLFEKDASWQIDDDGKRFYRIRKTDNGFGVYAGSFYLRDFYFLEENPAKRVSLEDSIASRGLWWLSQDASRMEMDEFMDGLAVMGKDVEGRDTVQMFSIEPGNRICNGVGHVEATYVTPPLDSGVPGMRWHRYIIEADIPERTQIQVSWQTSDTEAGFPAGKEWKPYDGGFDSREGLIDRGKGRYLWLRLRLLGEMALSPVISSIKVEFPRRTSLEHLPAIYREETESARFLEKYLALLDRFLDGMDAIYEDVPALMDPWGAPLECLEWLEAWQAMEHDPYWSEEVRRRLLVRAPALFRTRGTPRGLIELMETYTGETPIVVEALRLDEGGDVSFPNSELRSAVEAGAIRLNLSGLSSIKPGTVVSVGECAGREFVSVEGTTGNTAKLYSGLRYPHPAGTRVEVQPPGGWIFAHTPHEFHVIYPHPTILPYDILVWRPGRVDSGLFGLERSGNRDADDIISFSEIGITPLGNGGIPPGRSRTPRGNTAWFDGARMRTRIFIVETENVTDSPKTAPDGAEGEVHLITGVARISPIYDHSVLYNLSQDLSGVMDSVVPLDTPIPFRVDNFSSYRLVDGDAILAGLSQSEWDITAPPGRWRRSGKWLSDDDVLALQNVVDRERPAHTVGWVDRLEPALMLDFPSFLGLNTVLSRPTLILGVRDIMGVDTGPG